MAAEPENATFTFPPLALVVGATLLTPTARKNLADAQQRENAVPAQVNLSLGRAALHCRMMSISPITVSGKQF